MIINILLYLAIYLGMQLTATIILLKFYLLNHSLNKSTTGLSQLQLVNMIQQNTSVILIIAIFLSLIIYSIILAIKHKNIFNECSFKLLGIKKIAAIIFAGLGTSMIIDSILSLVPVDKWFPSHQEVVNTITGGTNFTITILTVGILVPIFEEILMRGIIFNELRRNMNLVLALILQALIFGIYHGNLLQGIYASILGLFLGLAYAWTKSIFAPILIHMLFNSSNLLLGKLQFSVNLILYFVIGLTLFLIGYRHLYKLTHRHEIKYI